MFLEQIKLTNFRNYEFASINLDKNINIFYGNNAQGKTNILESIYFLALTKSHRSSNDWEIIKEGKKSFKIEGKTRNNDIKSDLKIIYDGKKKHYYFDKNEKKKVSEYLSNLNVIIFYPDDINIIKGLPEERRKFLNSELSQIYPMYYKILIDYNKILKIRNDLLKKMSNNEKVDINYFNILNEYFIEKAVFLYRARKKFLEKLNTFAELIYSDIGKIKNFKLKYITSPVFIEYDELKIKKILKEKISKNINEEIRLGMSLYGPHRDDFEFFIDDTNLKKYGSQGQQKLAVLVLKLSEIELFKKSNNISPILLLDDVFSEFDNQKKNSILKYINGDIQTIITTTDLNNINKKILEKSKIFKIENGELQEIKR